MTREEAINQLELNKEDDTYVIDDEALNMAIKALEQKPGWIPVSERLPEKDGCYLVTEKSGRVCTYVFHKEGNSEEYWKRCVTAWQHLPEPYEGR